ncbi:EAL domain-containing response regulator [Kordiimonas marina]|uniref:EAL domain-containing response regulator n=1 Tax=Kordiimonas marina TaxID=2872312 RepID=UPI001FF47C21|nr:EAL domain-containing protein [Kordiimonas marina]
MTKRILVVDDSATMRELLMQYLRSGDYMVSGAENGVQALEILKTEQYDYIITDLLMPDMDGFALIRAISELDWDPGIILMTQQDERSLAAARELALAYSVNLLGTLAKPIDKDVLLNMLTEVAETRPKGRKSTETVLAETEFMRGLMTDGLSPVFQPKVDLRTRTVAGAEVFARWRSPSGGTLGAGAVVKAAREIGHMDVLTYRMLELAMEQQGKWRREGQEIALAVNVSSENLRKPDFADVVTSLAEQYEVEPKFIRLEVTESDLEVDTRVPLEVLSRLHVRGFGLALDDFGTGFASLMRLQTIPFDELVIDRLFLARAQENKVARTILETAVELAHKLELTCTCEGVETAEHLAMIKDLGADIAQGYFLGKPMSASEFLIWMEDARDGVLKVPGLND